MGVAACREEPSKKCWRPGGQISEMSQCYVFSTTEVESCESSTMHAANSKVDFYREIPLKV